MFADGGGAPGATGSAGRAPASSVAAAAAPAPSPTQSPSRAQDCRTREERHRFQGPPAGGARGVPL
eukprot:4389730-Pyramimonas_sp.AAC.1